MLIFASAFDNITRDIGKLFISNDYGIFGGDAYTVAIFGVFVFIIFLVLTLVFGLGMMIGSVVLIPVLFIVFDWIPGLRIVVALVMGLIAGMFFNRLVKR